MSITYRDAPSKDYSKEVPGFAGEGDHSKTGEKKVQAFYGKCPGRCLKMSNNTIHGAGSTIVS